VVAAEEAGERLDRVLAARVAELSRSRHKALILAGRVAIDRAMWRARKLCMRLGGDLADDCYPEKPKRMQWRTYNRLMDKLIAADGPAGSRLVLLAARRMR